MTTRLAVVAAILVFSCRTQGFFFGSKDREVCCPEVGCFPTGGIWKHLPAPTCVEEFGMEMLLYTQDNMHEPYNLTRHASIPSTFDRSVRTMFLIHGYRGNDDIQWMHDAKNHFLEQGAGNIILVGWEHGADEAWYPNSAANTRTVGAEVAFMADRFKTELDLPSCNLWCVGFSLGGQTCGFAGATTKFARITGLDPAGPWFEGYDPATRLDPTDAEFVDVIHCDGAKMGTLQELGHMDFYPNGGYVQPGCNNDSNGGGKGPRGRFNIKNQQFHENLCSHMRAPMYWLESLTTEGCFRAPFIDCTDSTDMPASCSPCIGASCAVMGERSSVWYLIFYPHYAETSDSSVSFYLETNYQEPFCQN